MKFNISLNDDDINLSALDVYIEIWCVVVVDDQTMILNIVWMTIRFQTNCWLKKLGRPYINNKHKHTQVDMSNWSHLSNQYS